MNDVYQSCMQTFDQLPVAAVVDGKLFCAHGGLSPNVHTLHDILKVGQVEFNFVFSFFSTRLNFFLLSTGLITANTTFNY